MKCRILFLGKIRKMPSKCHQSVVMVYHGRSLFIHGSSQLTEDGLSRQNNIDVK